jgi:molybdopterin-guanine dinucleotide biosynthesis protein A
MPASARRRPLLAHAIECLRPQADTLVLSANGDPARFASFRLPVVADSIEDFARPLGGVLAGMDWALAQRNAYCIVTGATDTPFFPLDLVARLIEATNGEALAVARSAEGEHYAFALWPIALAPDLRRALDEGRRKAGDFIHAHGAIPVDFDAERIGALSIDPFFNINEPGDLAGAEALLQQGAG